MSSVILWLNQVQSIIHCITGSYCSDANGLETIELIVGKLTDDLIVSGTNPELAIFLTATAKKWKLGKVNQTNVHDFNGATITIGTQGISVDMQRYVAERVKPIEIVTKHHAS